MNIKKLFYYQNQLRERIAYNEPDRFNKLKLALLVELGECANEQRSWKFWSKNLKPVTHKARAPYMDLDDADFYNPLLEEYVDGLHFVLEIGLELNVNQVEITPLKVDNITDQFIGLYNCISMIGLTQKYNELFSAYIGLGELLGFSWDEIEKAYFEKNKINHQRQESGVY